MENTNLLTGEDKSKNCRGCGHSYKNHYREARAGFLNGSDCNFIIEDYESYRSFKCGCSGFSMVWKGPYQ